MKIVRFVNEGGETQCGSLGSDGSVTGIAGDLFGNDARTGEVVKPGRLLAPVVPSCIFAIGLNYRKHADETGAKYPEWPVVFMKSPGAVQDPGGPIRLPVHLKSNEVDFEGELAVVIGRACKNVSKGEALKYVLGYTCANDVSARDWQKQFGGGQFCRGKTFDTFCPLGPVLVTPDELPDPNAVTLRTVVNGQVMQESSTRDMIFDVATIVSFLSGSTTLMPGTVILTGTPSGVGAARKPPVFLKAGDVVTVSIEGIGELTNPVEKES